MTAFPDTIAYGGDYNPEQWPEAVWDEDYSAFDLAHINTLSVNIFAWAQLEPAEGTYDFSQLDRIVDRLEQAGRRMVLATSTGALPPWLALAHPEVERTDFEGRRHVYGQRHNACPCSPVFRERSSALAGKLAERYATRPSLIAWHVGNEYGGACYCERCAAGFRVWLRHMYGSLAALNAAWNTTFWSHQFSDWEQIVPPNSLSEHWRGEDHTAFQGITLDYRRFMSDALLACFSGEKAAIRRYDPTTPVTTNFMGLYRPIDYFRWSDQIDFASWDNYPPSMTSQARMALTHDLNRGLKRGRPFWVMEQTPSRTASRDVNPVKRPGVMALWSWQAVAHGADAVLFFQMRASRGACEKYHGAVIDHSGRTDSRVFREVAALGAQFEAVGPQLVGGSTPARAALIWDWDSWWAWEMTDGINRNLKYIDLVLSYYRAWWNLGVDIDVVPADAELSRYDLVLAPLLHMAKGDVIDRLGAVASRGGTVVTGVMSGRVDESDTALLHRAGSPLAELAGIQIEEIDAGELGAFVGVRFGEARGEVDVRTADPADGAEKPADNGWETTAELVMEGGTPVEADVRAVYTGEFYQGSPAVTQRSYGQGTVVYIATLLGDSGMTAIARETADRHGLTGPYPDQPDIEVTHRLTASGPVVFILNHRDEAVSLPAPGSGEDLLSGTRFESGQAMELAAKGVRILSLRSA